MTEFQDTLAEKYNELEQRMVNRPLEFSVDSAMKEFDRIVGKFLNQYQIQKESPTAARLWEAAHEKKLELKKAFNAESKHTAEALAQIYQSDFRDLEMSSFLPNALQEQKRIRAYEEMKQKDFIQELSLNPNEKNLEYFGELRDDDIALNEEWFKKNGEKAVVPKAINGLFRGYSVCNGEPSAKTLLQKTFQQYQEVDTDWLGTSNLYYDDIGKIGLEQEWLELHKNIQNQDWYTPELQGYALGYLLAAKNFFKDQTSYDGYKTDLFEQVNLFREKTPPELFLQSLITPQEWVEARYSQVAQDVIAKIAPTYDLVKEMFPDFTFEGEKEFLRFKKEPPGRNEILQVKAIQEKFGKAIPEHWKKMQEDIAVILTHRAYFSGHGFKVPPISNLDTLFQPFDFSLLPKAIQKYTNLERSLRRDSEIFQKDFKRRIEESLEKLRKQYRSNRPEYKQVIGMLEQIEKSFPDSKDSMRPDHWEKLIKNDQDLRSIQNRINNIPNNDQKYRDYILNMEKNSTEKINAELKKYARLEWFSERLSKEDLKEFIKAVDEEIDNQFLEDKELPQSEKRKRLFKVLQFIYRTYNQRIDSIGKHLIIPSEAIFKGYEIKEKSEEEEPEKEIEEAPRKPVEGEPTIQELERQEEERIKQLRKP